MAIRFIRERACTCTHTLSLYSCVLVSARIPNKWLPATPCPCGKTWRRLKDGKLFTGVPELKEIDR